MPYTKIKSQPCQLILDQVFIEVETVENFRQNTNYFNRLSLQSSGKYGLGERIIDGLKVKIDSVEIHFTSSAFNAQLSLLQITVESRSPNFKPVDNIGQTKIKDTNRNQILIFKYIEWASLRFEARSESKTEEFQAHSSPLRLITRNGSCRVTLKKSLLDCSTISARVQLDFDDLLWILTDATVLNFIQLLNYISELMNRAPMNKKLIQESSPNKSQPTKKNSTLNATDMGSLFSRYDIIETSMHLIISRLQLHLSDDLNRSSFHSLKNGGGLHVILQKLLIDFYPYHKATASRAHWLRYTEASMSREPFISDHLKSFFKINGESAKNYSGLFTTSSNQSEMEKRLKDLLAFVILVRVGDYKINCVSTSENDRKGKKFSKDENVLIKPGAIPKDLPAIYLEICQYFYLEPGSTRISTRKKSPAPTLFVNIAPSFINFDIVTLLWFNAFYSSIHKSLLKFASTLPQTETETDFQVLTEIIMPTLAINLKNFYNETDGPANDYETLEIKSTKISIKNSKGSFDDNEKLDNLFSKLKLSKLFGQTQDYPWIPAGDNPNKTADYNYNCEQLMANLKRELNSCAIGFANQFLIVNCQPFWCDFKQAGRPNSTLIEPFDLTLWMQINKDTEQTAEPNLNVYCCFPDLKLHLDHFGYLFLIRLLEQIEHFGTIIKSDFTRIKDNDQQIGLDLKAPLVLIATVLPHIELFIRMNTYERDVALDNVLNNHSIQSNLSDKSSFLLSNENAPEKEDCFYRPLHAESTALDLMQDGTQLSGDRMSDPQLDAVQSEHSYGNGNVLVENVEEETIEVSASSNPFVGIFTSNKNGYTSISNVSMNTSLIEEDTRSIKSDLSVESERVVFNLEEDLDSFAFRSTDNEDNIEEGVEMTETLMKCEADFSPDYQPINRSKNAAVFISYLKMTLRHVSFLNQNKNFIATSLAAVQELELDSYFTVPYSQFEKDCSSTLDLFKPVNYSNEPNLLARIDTDTKSVSSKGDKEIISAILQGVDLKVFDKRFIDCVSEFLMDEDAVEVSKIKVLVDDLRLKIKDEQLKTPIIQVHLNNLLVDRSTNNEIQIGPFRRAGNGAHPFLAPHRSLINRSSGEQPAAVDCDEEIEFTREDYIRLLNENRMLKDRMNSCLP